MPNPKNIQIPYLTFKRLLEALEQIDLLNLDEILQNDLRDILDVLRAKQTSIDTRNAYSELIKSHSSENEEDLHEARIEYLKKRGPLSDI